MSVCLCVNVSMYVCACVSMYVRIYVSMYQTLLHPVMGRAVYAVKPCQPYSERACRDAATALGLQLGSADFPFKGSYGKGVTGCYAYKYTAHAGQAYYSTGGTVEDAQKALSLPMYRPANHDCVPGDQKQNCCAGVPCSLTRTLARLCIHEFGLPHARRLLCMQMCSNYRCSYTYSR